MSQTSKEIRDSIGLSKQLQVPPPRGNTIFKLMTKKNGGVNRVPFCSFTGEEVIYDPYQDDEFDKDLTLRYIKSKTSKLNTDGKRVVHEEIGDIEFDGSGVMIVKPTEYSKLVFMERSNYCESNKFRDKSVQPKWYKEAPGKSKTELLYTEVRVADCTKLILRMEAKELQANCKKFKLNHNAPIDDMKHSLILKAKQNPDEFINNVGSKEDKIKVLIEGAMASDFIEMDITNNAWIWCEGKEVITEFVPDKMEDEVLLEYLSSTKGKKALTKIKELLE